jgi:gamma-glutamyltranspeptidase/glutathione hydrolase
MSRIHPWLAALVVSIAFAIAVPAVARDRAAEDAPSAAARDAPEAASGWQSRPAVHARHAMVVAAHPLAADAALRMLRAGGSAADAAIAAQLVLGLVEPQSSGLGGGAFALYHDARARRLLAYDGRETAPAAARPDRFLDATGRPLAFRAALVGGRATGVPGVVRLLEALHRAHGRLPWRTLFEPAIALAEQGFDVSPRLAALLAVETPFAQARSRAYFFPSHDGPLQAGTRLRNPSYARTLRALAAGGADAFYTGRIAADIIATLDAAAPGRNDLTLADLAAYRVKVREPTCLRYRVYRACSAPPPAGGIDALEMLGLLEPYDVASMGPATFWSVHFVSEAARLAYADRVYVADPAFAPLPFDLLDPRYLAQRSRAIHANRTLGRAAPGTPPRMRDDAAWVDGAAAEAPSTSQVSIVDASGDAISMTTSIEYAFGARLMTPGGFLLNNELTDFAFVPEDRGRPVANRVEGGKRPRSAMSPSIVYDAAGRVHVVTGSVGGPWIIGYVAQSLVAVLDWKLDAQAAVALPHFGSRNGPTELERGTALTGLAERLQALGHDVAVVEQTSGTHVIVRDARGWQGGADPRREGVALGY